MIKMSACAYTLKLLLKYNIWESKTIDTKCFQIYSKPKTLDYFSCIFNGISND